MWICEKICWSQTVCAILQRNPNFTVKVLRSTCSVCFVISWINELWITVCTFSRVAVRVRTLSLPVDAGRQWWCFLMTLNSLLISVKAGMDRLQVFSLAHLLLCFSSLSHWNYQGQGYCGLKSSCLLTLASAEKKKQEHTQTHKQSMLWPCVKV